MATHSFPRLYMTLPITNQCSQKLSHVIQDPPSAWFQGGSSTYARTSTCLEYTGTWCFVNHRRLNCCWTETTKKSKDKRIEQLQLKNLCVACWEAMATYCTFCRQWHWRNDSSLFCFLRLHREASLAWHHWPSTSSSVCTRWCASAVPI